MTFSNYYVIKDSLIGVYQDNLFTLNWSGSNYKQRFLKNDGVEGSRINGVEILGDTVFLATTSGLFAQQDQLTRQPKAWMLHKAGLREHHNDL